MPEFLTVPEFIANCRERGVPVSEHVVQTTFDRLFPGRRRAGRNRVIAAADVPMLEIALRGKGYPLRLPNEVG
jgi:hypothetical protein